MSLTSQLLFTTKVIIYFTVLVLYYSMMYQAHKDTKQVYSDIFHGISLKSNEENEICHFD